MKKLLGLLTVTILVLAGCATGTNTASNCEEPVDGHSDITMVSDIGGIHDKSFNQGTWEGIEQYCAENPGTTATFIESRDESQYVPNLKLASENSDIVVAAGYTFEKPVYEVAQQHPETHYVLIDAIPTTPTDEQVELPNVQSYMFNEAQAGYLVGYIAGKTTETDKVGFVGGIESPAVQKFGWGFAQGLQDANPNATLMYSYTGSFTDSAIGKTTAETMYNSGADIIFTAAGGVNAGVIEAAKTERLNGNEVWVIGVDRDMYEDGYYTDTEGLQQSLILTSATKMVGTGAYDGIKASMSDTWVGGTTVLTYENNGVGLPAENPNLDQAIIDEATNALSNETDLRYDTAENVEEIITINVEGDL